MSSNSSVPTTTSPRWQSWPRGTCLLQFVGLLFVGLLFVCLFVCLMVFVRAVFVA